MTIVIVRLAIITLSYLGAVFVAIYFGNFYEYLFPTATSGGFIGDPDTINWIIGYPLAAIFIMTLLMHIFGGKRVWLWNLLALSPAILFEFIDITHIYLPIILGAIAWILGVGTNKILRRFTPGFMAKIS